MKYLLIAAFLASASAHAWGYIQGSDPQSMQMQAIYDQQAQMMREAQFRQQQEAFEQQMRFQEQQAEFQRQQQMNQYNQRSY